ncbi:Uncharacterised protein [Mycobacteroides abscessus subsp. abscessus]|nr:Uncharacterised protein [Mycobacteroides abscessus subsp. abscessus]SLC92813.1 Uncharacterised protein [Mycobacteroides abscessus subsp. massiliense]
MKVGMSTATPGYLLACQVPPAAPHFSKITKSWTPLLVNSTPAPIPPKPAPMITTS